MKLHSCKFQEIHGGSHDRSLHLHGVLTSEYCKLTSGYTDPGRVAEPMTRTRGPILPPGTLLLPRRLIFRRVGPGGRRRLWNWWKIHIPIFKSGINGWVPRILPKNLLLSNSPFLPSLASLAAIHCMLTAFLKFFQSNWASRNPPCSQCNLGAFPIKPLLC